MDLTAIQFAKTWALVIFGGVILLLTRKPVWFLSVVTVWLAMPISVHGQSVSVSTSLYGLSDRPQVVESYRSLRYAGVIGQTTWYTCGPAALATLLAEYYNMSATESEMLALTWEAMERVDADLEAGITMLALKEALVAKGVESAGYRVSVDQLVDYFVRGGLPIILHVTLPQPHYVVGVGLVNGYLVIGDPAFGSYLITPHDFAMTKGFQGNILVPLPEPSTALEARKNQRAALYEANLRVWQLIQLREGR